MSSGFHLFFIWMCIGDKTCFNLQHYRHHILKIFELFPRQLITTRISLCRPLSIPERGLCCSLFAGLLRLPASAGQIGCTEWLLSVKH